MSMANVIPLIDELKTLVAEDRVLEKYETPEARLDHTTRLACAMLSLRQVAASDNAFNALLVQHSLDLRTPAWRSDLMWLAEQINTEASGLPSGANQTDAKRTGFSARLKRCPHTNPRKIRQWFRDTEPNRQPKMSKAPKTTNAGRSPVVNAIREHVRPLVESGEAFSVADVAKATGRSRIVTEAAIAAERGRQEGLKEAEAKLAEERAKANEDAQAEVDRASLSKTAAAKLASLEQRLLKDFAARHEQLWRERFRSHVDEYLMPHYEEKLKKADLLMSQKKPLTRSEWLLLIRVAHPDNSASKETREEAFRLLKTKEVVLADPDPEFKLSSNLPKTLEELMAMREKVKEQNKARYQARRATTH